MSVQWNDDADTRNRVRALEHELKELRLLVEQLQAKQENHSHYPLSPNDTGQDMLVMSIEQYGYSRVPQGWIECTTGKEWNAGKRSFVRGIDAQQTRVLSDGSF